MGAIDRTEWRRGPWDAEPDIVEWTTAVGLPGLMLRQASGGNWCGYVMLPTDHPWHGVTCFGSMVGDQWVPSVVGADVHGGLTFAGPLRDREGWWIGFDCSHAWDLQPGQESQMRVMLPDVPHLWAPSGDQVYRRQSYVHDEVEQLAACAAARRAS